jgi:hypothetical protein
MEQEGGEVRRVGDEVVLALEERVGLFDELRVQGLLGFVLLAGGGGEHPPFYRGQRTGHPSFRPDPMTRR